jgi:hypothetical protein
MRRFWRWTTRWLFHVERGQFMSQAWVRSWQSRRFERVYDGPWKTKGRR